MKGRLICLGADIDTDVIIAGRYLRTKDRKVWVEHVFEDLDPLLGARLPGSVIIAGRNFGCGSSREQAAVALKEAGVVAVVAPSFSRIFFRNAINVGLPVVEGECHCARWRSGDNRPGRRACFLRGCRDSGPAPVCQDAGDPSCRRACTPVEVKKAMIFPRECKEIGYADTEPCGNCVYFLSQYLVHKTGTGHEIIRVRTDPDDKGLMRRVISEEVLVTA